MQNKKLITLIALSTLAVFSLIYGIVTPTKTGRRLSRKPAAVHRKQRGKLTEELLPAKRDRKKTDFASWGRDPFTPGDISAIKISELTLNGIIWDKVEPHAIINNEIVKLRDKVGSYTIVDITHNKVVISDGFNNFELRLEREE